MNPLIANFGGLVSFGFGVIIGIVLPIIGFVTSLVAMQRRGMNPAAAWASLLFFTTLLFGFVIRTLDSHERVTSRTTLLLYAVYAGLLIVVALLALRGLWQTRRRRRWSRGNKRAMWIFWLSWGFLAFLAGDYYLRTHPEVMEFLHGTPVLVE